MFPVLAAIKQQVGAEGEPYPPSADLTRVRGEKAPRGMDAAGRLSRPYGAPGNLDIGWVANGRGGRQ